MAAINSTIHSEPIKRSLMRHLAALYRTVVCACLAGALLAGCSQGATPQSNRTPPASIVALMLTTDDVPGGDTLVAQNNIVETTGCPQADMFLNLASSHLYKVDGVTVLIDAGDVEVMQTLILDVIEAHPNELHQSISTVISSCDGRTLEAPYWAMPTANSVLSESFSLTPAEQLPDGITGYTSTITAGDGAQRTFQRIYVPVKDNEGKTGLIALTTATAGNQPANPTPLDLLDTALTKANATIDPTATRTPTPAGPTTQQS